MDIKEGSFGNIVYRNEISGQMDVDAGGETVRLRLPAEGRPFTFTFTFTPGSVLAI